ncbi:MAG: nucleotidyltransferase family protein [Terriglobia bacterium]|nr:nucleotidyltransferase family protein [Terriglobia bacterium]
MTADVIQQRRAVLACFKPKPDLGEFLRITTSIERTQLLRWLDESGMAIYLVQRLAEHELFQQIDVDLRQALYQRTEANRRRTSVLLREFERVNTALQSVGIEYAVVKGFTLRPEFCPEPWLRHQSDIDLLISSTALAPATECLGSLGYKLEAGEGSGEICFALRSEHMPSPQDFIYDPPRHQHIEVHTDFYQAHCGVSLEVGRDWAEHIEWREIAGVRFPALHLPHRFLTQVLHVFRHTSSWARVAWLYEIARFVERFENNDELWHTTDSLLYDDNARRACGVVCVLVTNAFGTKFPAIIQETWIQPLPVRQMSWIREHADLWMLSDFAHASKTGLLLQREFADSTLTWWSYRAARYRKAIRKLQASGHTGPRFLMERVRRHMDYVWQSLKWSAHN